MVLREALIAICAGLASAAATMAFLSQTFMALGFVYLASLPMLMTGLAYGLPAAPVAAIVGTLTASMSGFPMVGVIFAIIHALPTLVITSLTMTRHTIEAGEIVSVITVLSAVMLIAVAFFVRDGGLSRLITVHLGEVFNQLAPGFSEVERNRLALAMTPLFPGVVAINFVVMTVVNTVIAQGVLVRIRYNKRPSPRYVNFKLPVWSSWPLVSAASLALVGTGEWEYMGRNLAMVLAIPYFFLGLSVFHCLARRVVATTPLLVALYLVIIISMWAALVVAGVGIVEQWFGLRNRFTDTPASSD